MADPACILSDAPDLAWFVLRARPPAMAQAAASLGFPTSNAPGRALPAGSRALLHLGPDEWWAIAPRAEAASLAADLAAALGASPHALVDISDRQAAFLLTGPGAPAVLNAFCPLDLREAACPVGSATRSLLGKAGMMLWRRAAQEWLVAVPRSFGAYAHRLLTEGIAGEAAA